MWLTYPCNQLLAGTGVAGPVLGVGVAGTGVAWSGAGCWSGWYRSSLVRCWVLEWLVQE